MIQDIEKGRINAVVVKDLSRLGREHLQSGQLIEHYFPSKKVRFIAIDNGIDIQPENMDSSNSIMVSFYNLMNEFYPMDISQKTRSALQAKAKQGQYLGAHAPYGYRKSELDKHKLIVNPEEAEVVRIIFNMAADGKSLASIAKELYRRNIPSRSPKKPVPCQWNSSSIRTILKNEVYLGRIIYGKRKNISYKNQTQLEMPKENWIIVENMHEAIISQDIFDRAMQSLEQNRCYKSRKTQHIFSNLLRCPECGNVLNFCIDPKKREGVFGYFVCRTNKMFGKAACSRHYISYTRLHDYVLREIAHFVNLLNVDLLYLEKNLLSEKKRKINEQIAEQQAKLDTLKERKKQLFTVFQKIYEDYALGKLPQERYDVLLANYEKEEKTVMQEIDNIETILSVVEDTSQNVKLFAEQVAKHKSMQELNRQVLDDLVEYIEVDNYFRKNGEIHQNIRIFYKFIGNVSLEK